MKDSVSAKVLEMIQNDIAKGHIKDGEIITERALVERYAVSRTPIKEALKALEREGWVEITPRQETRVTHFGINEIMEMLPIRISIESLAIKLCIQNMNDQLMEVCARLHGDLLRLGDLLSQRGRFADTEFANTYNALDSRMHNLLFDYCNSKMLQVFFTHLQSLLKRTYQRIPLEYERVCAGTGELTRVVRCMMDRQFVLAETHMANHIVNSTEQKRRYFAAIQGDTATEKL